MHNFKPSLGKSLKSAKREISTTRLDEFSNQISICGCVFIPHVSRLVIKSEKLNFTEKQTNIETREKCWLNGCAVKLENNNRLNISANKMMLTDANIPKILS